MDPTLGGFYTQLDLTFGVGRQWLSWGKAGPTVLMRRTTSTQLVLTWLSAYYTQLSCSLAPQTSSPWAVGLEHHAGARDLATDGPVPGNFLASGPEQPTAHSAPILGVSLSSIFLHHSLICFECLVSPLLGSNC